MANPMSVKNRRMLLFLIIDKFAKTVLSYVKVRTLLVNLIKSNNYQLDSVL
jgi:hypothetical protein